MESSLLNALGRGESIGAVTFRTDDFRVREMTRENKLIAGLLVDTSMSMQMKGVMATARDTSLALAELIGENSNHVLKVYLFADHVKETPPREVFRNTFPGGLKDICAPLEKFRERVRLLEGEKQAYLITDSVSNMVNGRRVGFEEAAPRVLEEASRYRKEKITLNIVMLGEQERFKDFCLKLAQRSMGRVFFVSSDSMAQTIVIDGEQNQTNPKALLTNRETRTRCFEGGIRSLLQRCPVTHPSVVTVIRAQPENVTPS